MSETEKTRLLPVLQYFEAHLSSRSRRSRKAEAIRSIRSKYLSKNVKISVERIFKNPVAEIPPETIAKILELLGRLSILIDRASNVELSIFNTYGETEQVVSVLEQLQNTKERGVDAYTRLSGLMLKISGFQPSAPTAMVKMLTQSIDTAEATVDAGEASVKEAKSDWNIS